jgi:hypothetical protein
LFGNECEKWKFMGARRIRENQKPPNSRNKNRQIEEPRLQILESLKNGIFEYNPSLYVKR